MGLSNTPSLKPRGGWGELSPNKLRGQHFLTDARVIEKIIVAAELETGDTVVEVGPGLGALTRALLPKVKRLIAVELDPYFVKVLGEEFADAKNLEIIEGDILKMNVNNILSSSGLARGSTADVDSRLRGNDRVERNDSGHGYKIVTNLPYNITSEFFRKFLTTTPRPVSITATIQVEVAERMIAPRPPTSMFTLLAQLHADCRLVTRVSAGAFVPPPKVSSAVVHLRLYTADEFIEKWGILPAVAEEVLTFASHAFRNPRKKLPPNYRDALREMEESPDSRPAALSVQKWVNLWKSMR